MNSWPAHYRFIFFMAVVGAILGGCAPVQQRIVEVCPGAQSAQQALSLLKSNWENAASIKANGTAHICYYDDGLHKENFPVKLWANPPAEVYMQGDVAFDAKGITFGSNKDEFWLAIRPKEVSSYWWGQWSKQACFKGLVVSPKLMLEALGIMEITADENWSLSKEDGFDVLSKRNNRDTIVKRIYVDACGYLVRKIEYFDADKPVAVAELDKYKEVAVGFFVPAVIKIVAYAADDGNSISITVSLSSIKSTDFTEKQRGRLFTRPSPQGFEHIYKIVDGDVIEQTR
jgi:hypothetical protein